MKTLSIEQLLQASGGENKVTYEFVIYASYFDAFQKYLDQYQQNKITAQQLVSLSYSYSAPKTTSGYSTILISV